MEINNDIKELILEYVRRYFKFENDFYKLPNIKFTDTNWQKFKNGDTSIEKMGAGRANAMLDCLFDDFEAGCNSALCGVSVYGSNKFVLASTHPSPLSASRAAGGMPAFLGSRPFSKTNALLLEAGAAAIDWASLA